MDTMENDTNMNQYCRCLDCDALFAWKHSKETGRNPVMCPACRSENAVVEQFEENQSYYYCNKCDAISTDPLESFLADEHGWVLCPHCNSHDVMMCNGKTPPVAVGVDDNEPKTPEQLANEIVLELMDRNLLMIGDEARVDATEIVRGVLFEDMLSRVTFE